MLDDRYRSLNELAKQVCATVKPGWGVVPPRQDDWPATLQAALLDPDDNCLVQAAFPPRTPQDMGIRNARVSDVWRLYSVSGRQVELEEPLCLLQWFNYVSMANILLAKVVFVQQSWWDALVLAGAFQAGAEHFRACSRVFSDRVKKENVASCAANRMCFYEVASLYRTMCPPPVPGWDPIEKTRELAEGERDQHGLLIEDGTGYSGSNFLHAI